MKKSELSQTSARKRFFISAGIGIVIGIAVAAIGGVVYAPLAGWDAAALAFVGSVLITVLRYDADGTKQHALSENPGRGIADVLLLVTSVASIAAVGVLILRANNATGIEKAFDIALGLFSVVVSWSVVHTLFMLNYARQYYGSPEGGIDFNEQAKPRYADFAYVAFTVGMTFQVSDTQIKTKAIRATILRHALLSYVFGTVIIATTINTVVTLSSN
jgi:uncharacterized membrane protein